MASIRKAVIPAAGLGTRFLPATKAQPKEMLPVVDKPAIQYIIEEVVASGITNILIITGRNKRAIEDHFDCSWELESALAEKGQQGLLEDLKTISSMAEIHYIRQKEPRGLGHAVYCARHFVGDEPFAVLLGDDLIVNSGPPCLAQMLELYQSHPGNMVALQEVAPVDVQRYGILEGTRLAPFLYQAERLVEKPSVGSVVSHLAIVGRYILQPEIFAALENLAPGAGGEIQLTDALIQLLAVQPVYGFTFQGCRYDLGDKLGFLQATVELALSRSDLREDFYQYLKGVIGQGDR